MSDPSSAFYPYASKDGWSHEGSDARISSTCFGIMESWLDSKIPKIPVYVLGNRHHVNINIRRNTKFYKNISESVPDSRILSNFGSHKQDSESVSDSSNRS